MSKKKKKEKKNCSFPFDAIVTTMDQKITRDLDSHPALLYGVDRNQSLYNTSVEFFNKAQKAHTLKQYVKQSFPEFEDVKEEKTYEKFRNVNDHMAKYGYGALQLPPIEAGIRPQMSKRDRILLRSRAVVRSLLTPFTQKEWDLACKNSKGSSIGVPYVDTTDVAKFKIPMSSTLEAVPLFRSIILKDKLLFEAILENNPEFTGSISEMFEIVQGSRATTVAKNDDIRRMIAIEPTVNMYLQQGLMTMMYYRMKRCFLDVECLPSIHQVLAQISSLTGLNATVDWSSASDCEGIDVVEFLLPPQWFNAIHATRSSKIQINSDYVDLHMISTMGNAVTFPLETIIFWALGISTVFENENHGTCFPVTKEEYTRVSVFGDDCILPSVHANDFIEVCTSLGFIVNKEKSFVDNSGFRESCGGDYYRGIDVRPFHLKAPPALKKSCIEPWLYNCINKVLTKYKLYFGPLTYLYGKEIIQYIIQLLKDQKIAVKLVPDFFPDDSGLKIGEDLPRFVNCYEMDLSPISSNIHGEVRFNFCRWTYNNETPRLDLLAYAIWLKQPKRSVVTLKKKRKLLSEEFEKIPMWGIKRIKGGYVVGASLTSYWSEPNQANLT